MTESLRTGGKRFLGLAIATIVLVVAMTLWGRFPRAGFLLPEDFRGDGLALRILLQVRLPRMAGALLLGAVLGLAGSVFQYVFANPLVDSGFLGVSQGAGLGSIVALIFGWSFPVLLSSAFIGAFISLGLAILLAKKIRFGGLVLRLVLAGIAVSSVFSALLSLLKFTADPLKQLPEITYWLMGGLSGTRLPQLLLPGVVSLIAVCGIMLVRWDIGLLALDDTAVKSLRKNANSLRVFVLALSVAGVASVTAYAGIVPWAGLIVPHIARMLFGADTRVTLPASMIIGAVFMAFCDTVARSLFPIEIPLGIVTAVFGCIVFVLMLITVPVKVERA